MKKVTETAPTMTHKTLKKEKCAVKRKEAVNLLDAMDVPALLKEKSLIKLPALSGDAEKDAVLLKEYEGKVALIDKRIAKLEKKDVTDTATPATEDKKETDEMPDSAKVFPGEVYIVDNNKEYRNKHMGITFKDLKKIEGFRIIRRKIIPAKPIAEAPEKA